MLNFFKYLMGNFIDMGIDSAQMTSNSQNYVKKLGFR